MSDRQKLKDLQTDRALALAFELGAGTLTFLLFALTVWFMADAGVDEGAMVAPAVVIVIVGAITVACHRSRKSIDEKIGEHLSRSDYVDPFE